MTLDEAGRLQDAWKIRNGYRVCHHARIVDSLVSKTGRRNGRRLFLILVKKFLTRIRGSLFKAILAKEIGPIVDQRA
jgi:hypothetical protein